MLFFRFIAPNADLGQELSAAYNPFLVALSFFVAALGGYAALEVVERMASAPSPQTRRRWLAAGAAAMGSGIWSMHFIGMLAFSLPIPVSYDLTITLLSMVPAVFASAMALHFMDRARISWWRLNVGGLLMALGIGSMHYTGMEAMRMDAMMGYAPLLFALSIFVAHVLATLALYIKFFPGGTTLPFLRQVAGAGAMGCAVACMHYTAMHAARFYPGSMGSPRVVFEPRWMAVVIAVVTSVIIAVAIAATLVDRRTAELVTKRDDKRLRYRVANRLATATLAQAMREALTGSAYRDAPEVVWEDRGSQFLLHVGRLQVRTLDNALVVAVDAETAEFGVTPLIVRFVFGDGRDPAALVASSDETVHGHPLVAARWGPLFRGVIWSAIVRLSEAHADERGLRPTSIVLSKGHLGFAAEPHVPIQKLAVTHLQQLATKPAKNPESAGAKPTSPKRRRRR